MPELPEVETTCRGIAPHLVGEEIERLVVRNPALRWPVPDDLGAQINGRTLTALTRRGKYLLFETQAGVFFWHLGMSGSMRVLAAGEHPPAGQHDHIDLVMRSGQVLRYNDPRRFGCLLWAGSMPFQHPLLARLGVEPLSAAFDGDHLFRASRGRARMVKAFIMDSQVVVGVGNIYASESLFAAGILPQRAAGRVSLARYQKLAEAIKAVLEAAIKAGGTTLQDFNQADGRPGYFAQKLNVYGRAGAECVHCGQTIVRKVLGQRMTYYCSRCQR